MNILICGANGYLGSVLTPALCQLGHRVTAADVVTGPSLFDACRYKNLEIKRVDCLNEKDVAGLIKDADFIYWLVGATSGNEQKLRDVNVGSATILAEHIGKGQTICYAQTNAGYRPTNSVATEDTPMIGGSAYSRTKIEAEKILMDTGRCVSFRLAAIYGPAPTIRWETLLNYMTYHAVNYPERPFEIYQPYVVRDVLFTTDLVNRMKLPLIVDLAGRVFNLSGQSLPKTSFLEHVFEHPVFRGEPHRKFVMSMGDDPDQRNFSVSEEKFRRFYECHAGPLFTTSLEDGIAMTIKAARLES